jgi:hypothetical protein
VKILLLDIETAPIIAALWQLRTDYVPPDHIMKPGYTLCVSTKWLGEAAVRFHASWDGKAKMLRTVHAELTAADAVVHFNGRSFDIPILQREFVEATMRPPAPYKQVDLLQVVKSKFRFESSKLDYVCRRLGLGVKIKHKGMDLWWECMQGDTGSQAKMRLYNQRDVVLLEKLYHRLLPWVDDHPNRATLLGVKACPACGSEDIKKSGWAYTEQMKYQRYACNDCGKWFRGNVAEKRNAPADRVTQIRA